MKTGRGRIVGLVTAAVSVLAFAGLALLAASEGAWPLAAGAIVLALSDAFRAGALFVEWSEAR